jgi:hypothetical protein
MLPERIRRLLTAYVDGELEPQQREIVMRALRRSAEARALLSDLEKDADQLRGLPRQCLGQDFSEHVLQIIAGRKAHCSRRFALTTGSYTPTWLGLASAAAVLLVAVFGSYVYFAAADRQKQAQLLAVHNPKSDRALPQDRFPKSEESAPSPAESVLHESLGPPRPDNEAAAPSSSSAFPRSEAPKPRAEAREGPLGSPIRQDTEPFKDPQMHMPFVVHLRDLDQEKQRLQLRQELLKEAAHGMDLRCTNTFAGIERLGRAFNTRSIQLIMDEDARAILDLHLERDPSFALYVENITTDEMIAILEQLGSEDRKAESRRRSAGRFESLTVNAMDRAEQQKSLQRLGIEIVPSDKSVPKPKADAAAEPGQGTPRSVLARPVAGIPDRQALVVAHTPGRPRPMSAELKRFLESRKDQRSGTLQILLILRPAKD